MTGQFHPQHEYCCINKFKVNDWPFVRFNSSAERSPVYFSGHLFDGSRRQLPIYSLSVASACNCAVRAALDSCTTGGMTVMLPRPLMMIMLMLPGWKMKILLQHDEAATSTSLLHLCLFVLTAHKQHESTQNLADGRDASTSNFVWAYTNPR